MEKEAVPRVGQGEDSYLNEDFKKKKRPCLLLPQHDLPISLVAWRWVPATPKILVAAPHPLFKKSWIHPRLPDSVYDNIHYYIQVYV